MSTRTTYFYVPQCGIKQNYTSKRAGSLSARRAALTSKRAATRDSARGPAVKFDVATTLLLNYTIITFSGPIYHSRVYCRASEYCQLFMYSAPCQIKQSAG